MSDYRNQFVPIQEAGRVTDPATGRAIPYPAGATAELAIRRAARERAGEISDLRFFPDHGFEWCLWDADRGYTSHPSHYDLSEELVSEILDWFREWSAQIGINFEWDSPESRQRWMDRGEALVQRLANEAWWYANTFAGFRKY